MASERQASLIPASPPEDEPPPEEVLPPDDVEPPDEEPLEVDPPEDELLGDPAFAGGMVLPEPEPPPQAERSRAKLLSAARAYIRYVIE
ncbi:hypothetical protein [Microbulbifer magnicolonia]|uniref:hypothetical protein n=1 Tax=Microbulbifer magnicolonia TaxID=3109744 RepID=UPI002B4049AF|nr:hypothetical protein [Microbulbifer sp. GG15]